MANAAIVEARKIGKSYGKGDATVHALTDANLALYPGEILIVRGPSGSGKTTLLSIMGLILRPSSGELFVEGQATSQLPEKALPHLRATVFGFIFQGFNLFAPLTALENVVLGTRMKNPRGRSADADREARQLLEAVGLKHRMHHRPADMSGGEKQRVAIARALGGGPKAILADEPTAALDTKSALGVVDLLQHLAKEKQRSVVVVTHDPRLDRFADRVVVVQDGRILAAEETGS
jgi:putative ABC transport system ATP-binding protein